MASGTLRSYLSESKNRPADRAAFVQVLSRLSSKGDSKRDKDSLKPAEDGQKAA